MAVERARTHALAKPWGDVALYPWSNACADGSRIGEIWYERSHATAGDPALLLKLLFTTQPLSIQVHPDDAAAHSVDQRNGKTEAWYILSAAAGAKVALGLKACLTSQQLRDAIETGSIADHIQWQDVSQGDIISVPARTIHTIGAGLVIAEVQQRSDTTYRLFDYGRAREIHVERAVAVADAGPVGGRVMPRRLTDARTLLISNPYFVIEKADLAPTSAWSLETQRETWVLVLNGGGRVGAFDVGIGDAIFVQSDRVDIRPGPLGMAALAAYTGGDPAPQLLQPIEKRNDAANAGRSPEAPLPPLAAVGTAAATTSLETAQ